MNYSELLQLAKGWGNFISDRIIIWRLHYIDLIFARKIDIELLKVNEVNRAMEFNSVYKCSEQTMAAYHIIEKG